VHQSWPKLGETDHSAYIIAEGRIFRQGPPLALVSDPAVRRGYLGEKFAMAEIPGGREAGIGGEEEAMLFGPAPGAPEPPSPKADLLSKAEELVRESEAGKKRKPRK
jgi:hypothetical protein